MRRMEKVGHVRRVALGLARAWARLGLLMQSLLLAALTLVTMQLAVAEAERRFAHGYLFDTAMEMEQAILSAVLLQFVADLSPGETPSPNRLAAVDAALMPHFAEARFDMVKLWSTEGQLIYSSHGAVTSSHASDETLARSIAGETIVTAVEDSQTTGMYEIYIPLANANGEIVAVGEIYCRFETLVGRIAAVSQGLVQQSLIALVFGMSALCALVGLAQARIFQSEKSHARSISNARELSLRNSALNSEVDRLHRERSAEGDVDAMQMRAELRDGPMQLLSIAALYASQIVGRESCRHEVRRARDLTNEAMESLRRLAAEPKPAETTSPESCDIARCAVAVFERETGRHVTKGWAGTAGCVTVAAPEAVIEVLVSLLRACDEICSDGSIAVSGGCVGGRLRFVVDCSIPPDSSATICPAERMEALQCLQTLAASSDCSLYWSGDARATRVVAGFTCEATT